MWTLKEFKALVLEINSRGSIYHADLIESTTTEDASKIVVFDTEFNEVVAELSQDGTESGNGDYICGMKHLLSWYAQDASLLY
jgi:hypothetical protein